MPFLDRREFLKDSAIFAAALAVAQAPRESVLAAADTDKRHGGAPLRVAIVGVRGRGRDHVAGFAGKHGCVVTTICDCDEAVVGPAMTSAAKAQNGTEPKFVKDLRRVIDDKNIDIVSIATPNHWHALAAIWAMQAGKDVYVEKPVSHNVSEGRRIVEAARKFNRICQSGTQSRSMTGLREAIEHVRTKIGKVELARGICYKLRPSIGKVDGPQEPPQSMDYDLWCGPAPLQKPHRKTTHGTVHYDWHWMWETGNGDLGNQGIHEMDKARWGLGKDGLPNTVISLGGRLGYQDDGQTPNTQLALLSYDDCRIIFEVRGLPTKSPYPEAVNKQGVKGPNFVGNIFYGTKGTVVCPNGFNAFVLDPKGEIVKEFKGDGDHFGNFVQAVRSRKNEDLNADILEGHVSSALCHLANISQRLGKRRRIGQDSRGMGFGDEGKIWDIVVGTLEHLVTEHKLDPEEGYTVGRYLYIDPKTETFRDDKEANALLTREYRKGFEVPAKL